MMAAIIILSGGGKGRSKTWMSLPAQPSDHLNHQAQINLEILALSGLALSHFIDSPTGCFLYRSPMPENPKNVFSAALAHPLAKDYSSFFINKRTGKSEF